jgi:hypothetical protein
MPPILAAAIGGQGLSEHAEPDDTSALRFCLRARFHELRQTGTGQAPSPSTGQHHRPWPVPYAAAMSSAKSPWIRAGRGHGMLGLDRPAGKRLEESEMPSDVNAQIEWDRLVQTVVCRR